MSTRNLQKSRQVASNFLLDSRWQLQSLEPSIPDLPFGRIVPPTSTLRTGVSVEYLVAPRRWQPA